VLLGINMQTSFMHPPFGFSLFYLRSVAPRQPYTDAVTGRRTEGVTTGEIYWGAVPFVIIQIIMIGITIAFPQLVMHYRGAPAPDSSTIRITLPPMTAAGGERGPGLGSPPSFGLPGAPDLSSPPSFGPAPGSAPAPRPAPDLSQPPSFGPPAAPAPQPQ
jgi:hypothetical protein